jgi:hypothetical protein
VLPDLWTAQDIGGGALNGASTYNPLTRQWVLTGAGANPGGAFDQAQFASRPWTANGIVTARVDALSGPAGIMVRNPGSGGAAFVALVLDGAGGLELLSRPSDGAAVAAPVRRTGVVAGPSLILRPSSSQPAAPAVQRTGLADGT